VTCTYFEDDVSFHFTFPLAKEHSSSYKQVNHNSDEQTVPAPPPPPTTAMAAKNEQPTPHHPPTAPTITLTLTPTTASSVST